LFAGTLMTIKMYFFHALRTSNPIRLFNFYLLINFPETQNAQNRTAGTDTHCDNDKQYEAILNQHEKSNKLYKIVLTRENAYKYLIVALEKCRQTGAMEILKRLEVEGDSSIGRIPQQNIQHCKSNTLKVDNAKISYDKNFLIGKGSSGTAVFKGTFGGRPVAVKRVNIANQDELSNAQEEAKKLILCDRHVNVVRYFYAEKIEDYFLVALELCTCTLEGWVCKKVITANITDILRQITEGLAYLHSRRIIHRDIKPQNILLLKDDSDNQVYAKLADFGISKQLSEDKSDLTVTSSSGTEGWMAPELLQTKVDGSPGFEEKQGKWTDIFALGCVFYYIISGGKHPFGTTSPMRLVNILSNRQTIVANDIEAHYRGGIKLIQMMTHHNRQERCSLIAIRKHPVMWDNKKALQFLVDVSNLAENSGSIVEDAITRLEGNKEKVLGIQGAANWFSLMSAAVLLYIKSKKKMYNGDEVMKLIRAVRNMQNHYEKLPLDAKTEVGALPDQFMLYFISRFPNLVSSAWVAFETAKASLSSYYDENCDFNLEF
ncbi:Serine/threonine-protein kinase/endoribonuclease IRE2, partial [Orchesella cincta]